MKKDIWVLNQQTRNPNRPSLKYSSGGSGPLWKKNIAFCIPTTGGSGQYVLINKNMKKLICFNCKEPISDDKIKVRQKGKIRTWCLTCYEGYLIEKQALAQKR